MTTSRVQRCSSGPAAAAGRAGLDDERAWRYVAVECERCGASVDVAKFSLQHTSVQWSAEAVLRCTEFSAQVAEGGTSALIATCASLRASIEVAVSNGRVEILPP